MASVWGIVAFTIIAVAFGISQYFILEIVKRKSKDIRGKSTLFRILSSTVTIIQYVLTAIFALIVFQILVNSHYYAVVLNLGSAITYGLATVTMRILTSKFFLWYKSNRNFVVLLYGVSTATVSITMLLTLVFVSRALSALPGERNPQSQAPALYLPAKYNN